MGPFTYTATLSHLTSRRVNQTQLPQISAALTGHNIAKSPQCDYACVVRPGSQARQRPASWLWAGPTWNALLAEHPVISWQCVSIQHKIHKCLYIYTYLFNHIHICIYTCIYIYTYIHIVYILYNIIVYVIYCYLHIRNPWFLRNGSPRAAPRLLPLPPRQKAVPRGRWHCLEVQFQLQVDI